MGADVFFGGGGEDGVWESGALGEARRQRDAADGAGGLVVLPAGAFEVASDDALDGDDAASACDHDAAGERFAGERAQGGVGNLRDFGREQVGAADAGALDEAEPEDGHVGEDAALGGQRRGKNDVEGGEAVGGDDEQTRGVGGGGGEVVDVADLAFAAIGEGQGGGGEGGHEWEG